MRNRSSFSSSLACTNIEFDALIMILWSILRKVVSDHFAIYGLYTLLLMVIFVFAICGHLMRYWMYISFCLFHYTHVEGILLFRPSLPSSPIPPPSTRISYDYSWIFDITPIIVSSCPFSDRRLLLPE